MDKKQLLELRKQAHALKPVVMIGQHGLTQGVHDEIETAIKSHELIKIRVNASDNDEFNKMANEICEKHQADLIKTIGHIAVVYREKTED